MGLLLREEDGLEGGLLSGGMGQNILGAYKNTAWYAL